MVDMEYMIHNLDEMRDFAKSFLRELECGARTSCATVVSLSGDLGAGKTAFVKELAKELGIEQHITSPTFVIFKKYHTAHSIFRTLVHIDAYRLQKGEDLESLGWSDLIKDPKNLILLEWPEMVRDCLSDDIIKLRFEYLDEDIRKIIF